ncbi:MAG: hypothetical protein ABR563_07690 [Pyrinomonadaceae bacterium]
MEPEIARRCLACGAAVRGAARFCPQCGQPLAHGARAAGEGGAGATAERANAASAQPTTRAPLADEAARVAAQISGRLDARPADVRDANAPAADENAPAADENASPSVVSAPPPVQSSPSSPTPPPGEPPPAADVRAAQPFGGVRAAGRVRERAAAVGAVVGETLRPRAEKLRERSVVVLDEAADDPGVRYVVVAAALTVVALILFALSFLLR